MNGENLTYHVPVLLHESIDGLDIKDGGVYVDVTFGGGGHSNEILKRLPEGARLFSFDQDADAERNIIDDEKFTFVRSNFRYLKNFMRFHGVEGVDGILADLGVSSHHFDDSERGFSFRFDGNLDMRMNQTGGRTAADLLNTYSEEDLARVLYIYGELKNSRQIAKKIVKARGQKAIERTEELVEVVMGKTPSVPLQGGKDGQELDIPAGAKKDLARLFQALRIEVNDEMGALREMLLAAKDLLKPGGRIVILTYHSLEDRMVKNFLRSGNLEGKIEKDFYGNILSPFKVIEKGLTASEEEVERNPRARSAKLRVAEKIV